MQRAKIVLLCIVAAVVYGVLHDQVTARLCLEYFTVAHPPLFRTTDPTLLALGWGSASTAGIGLLLGMLLAAVSQSPGRPPVPIRKLGLLILALLMTMALAALAMGLLGYELSQRSIVSLPRAWRDVIPEAQHHRFMAAWFAHAASYLIGLSGAAVLITRIWLQRGRPRVMTILPRTRAAIIRAAILLALLGLAVWLRLIP